MTLLEVLVVVAILAVVGTAVIPRLDRATPGALAQATTNVAAALRFARETSRRTGLAHSVEFDTNTQQLLVLRYPDFTAPSVPKPVVVDPLSSQPYRLQFGGAAAGSSMLLGIDALSYVGTGAQTRIDFDAMGVPHFHAINGARYRLSVAQIRLSSAAGSMRVSVLPLTGRVLSAPLSGGVLEAEQTGLPL